MPSQVTFVPGSFSKEFLGPFKTKSPSERHKKAESTICIEVIIELLHATLVQAHSGTIEVSRRGQGMKVLLLLEDIHGFTAACMRPCKRLHGEPCLERGACTSGSASVLLTP